MSDQECGVVGCEGAPYARGWCSKHYQRWMKHGDVRWERAYPPVEDRFWSRVAKGDGCWLWSGKTNGSGYGTLMVDGMMRRAHRVAWELTRGPIPEGLCVLHRCDNRRCVNPDHLFIGTYRDNRRDCVSKGRHANNGKPGESHYRTKLTEELVREIRRRYADGMTRTELAEAYELRYAHVDKLVLNRSWRHIGEAE
jgi:hypothetical protein